MGDMEALMPFDWMQTSRPAPSASSEEATRAMHEQDVVTRSSLLRRLGHPQEYALHRCLGNLVWAYDVTGTPPLSVAEVRALVKNVYGKR